VPEERGSDKPIPHSTPEQELSSKMSILFHSPISSSTQDEMFRFMLVWWFGFPGFH
jgi:hypothetical protein